MKPETVVSVFWPNDIVLNDENEKYVVLGYNINKYKTVIIDIIKRESFEDMRIKDNNPNSILEHLKIIGTINYKLEKQNSKILEYDFIYNKPILSSNEVLIIFKPPKSWKLEYFSLDPITINIFWNSNDQARSLVFQKPTTNKYGKKMNYHLKPEQRASVNKSTMRDELRIINLTNYIRSKINPEANVSIMSKIPHDIKFFLEILFTVFSFLYLIFIQKLCYIISNILTYPFLKLNYKLPNEGRYPINVSMTSVSYTFHQINFKLRQLYNLPLQFKKLKISKIESESSILKGTRFSPSEYIKFYNTVWLIVNDLLLGIIFSNFLRTNHKWFVNIIQRSVSIYEDILGNTITWLLDSPAGFKLNNELTLFLGQLIFWVLDLWNHSTLKWIQQYPNEILIVMETLTKYCGLTLFISLLQDIANVVFINIYGFYVACTRLYNWQLNILSSLLKLFYGKKYNILRNRVDSNDYEFDQLMLGIIIFTILVYLLPTVFVFYLTFVLARIFILSVAFTHKFLLILLNHIPIVVFLLKLKNQERLPSGVYLDFRNTYFVLKSRPLTLKQIYRSHMNSMLNFNLFNLNHTNIDEQVSSSTFKSIKKEEKSRLIYNMSDVVNNWSRISLINLTKSVLFGETIQDYDYKSMF